MDKNRLDGAGKQMAGGIKEAAGKLTGDQKLKAEGRVEKGVGKVQNAVGGAADTARKGDRRS